MFVRLHARPGRGAAVTLVAVLAAVGLLLTGPFGATAGAEAAPDPETPVAVAPVFPKVDFQPAADGMPCRKETLLREGAEKNSKALKDLYDVFKENARRGAGSEGDVLERAWSLAVGQAKLAAAMYAEAACYLGLSNAGKGDKCKALALDYNRIAALVEQQTTVFAVRKAMYAAAKKALGVGVGSPTALLDQELAMNDAETDLKILKSDLVGQENALKRDCAGTDYKRPVPPPDNAPPDEDDPTTPADPTGPADPTLSTDPSGSAAPTVPVDPSDAPPPTGPVQSSTVAVPPADGLAACPVSYRVAASWPSGFSADITITNTGSAQLTAWALAFTFSGSQHIASAWNSVAAQAGADVLVHNTSYNGTVPPGGTVSFGFQASYSGGNTDPARFNLNGALCTVA
ncbi:MAG: hypothetical protein V7637_347 [Mycobacteriales bacterium]